MVALAIQYNLPFPVWLYLVYLSPSKKHTACGKGPPGWLGMGPSNCVKPTQHISLQESTAVTHSSELEHESPSTSCSTAGWPASGVHRPEGLLSCVCVCVPECECVSTYCLDELSYKARSVSERPERGGGVRTRSHMKDGERPKKRV